MYSGFIIVIRDTIIFLCKTQISILCSKAYCVSPNFEKFLRLNYSMIDQSNSIDILIADHAPLFKIYLFINFIHSLSIAF